MNGLFMPKEMDGRDLLEEKVEMNLEEEAPPVIKGDNVLAFATMNKIFILEPETGRTECLFTEPNFPHILDLCLCGGQLYHATGNNVVNTITAETVAVREGDVRALTSYHIAGEGNCLYDAGDYGTIYQTLTKRKIARYNYPVKSMVARSGILYSVSDDKIYRNDPYPFGDRQPDIIWAEEIIKYLLPSIRRPVKVGKEKIQRKISDITLHQGSIYDCGKYTEIVKTLENNVLSAAFSPYIKCLASHEGELYGGSPLGILNIGTAQKIFATSSDINSLESIPRKLVERYLR